MSTLRVSNIEAKADVSSPSVHEKIKVTNSEGDVLVHIDGATSGISTVGINTTVKTFDVDSNQNIDFVGNLTAPNITVTGTLSYDDVTSIDSVGVITARAGVNISGGNLQVGGTNVINSGRVLYNLEQLKLADTKELVLGSSDDLKIYHSGSHSFISEEGAGALKIKGDDIRFEDAGGTEALRITSDGFIGINNTSPELQSSAARNLVIGTPGSGGQNGLTICSNTSGTNNIYFGDASSGQGESMGRIVYSHADDSLTFHTVVQERLRITSDGKIGIGINNPTLTAHIYSTANADAALIESTQNFATLRFKSALNSSGPTIGIDGAGGLQLDQKDTSKYISFAIGSERLRIASNGTTTVGPQYDQVKIEPGNGTYDGEATTLSVDGRTNDGNRVALKVDRYDSGTSATTKFSVRYDGLVNIGGAQFTTNTTPSSGRGVEIFAASAGVGQVQSYNRGSSSWDELRLKGSEVRLYANNNLRLDVQNAQSFLYGTSDGILNLDTTDQRGAFIRFKENGTTKGWSGCSEGIGTGGDQDDFGIRAVGGFRLRTGTTNRIEITDEGQITLKPLTGGFSTQGATGTYPGAAVSIQTNGVGAGTGTNIPNYGLYVDATGSSNDATLMTGIYVRAKQNVEGSAIGVHGLYHQDWNSYARKIGGLFQAPARATRYVTKSFNPGGGQFANTTSTGQANALAAGGPQPDGTTPASATYGDVTALWGDTFRSDTDTSSNHCDSIAIKATNRVTHGRLRTGLMVGMVDGNDTTYNRRKTQFVEYYANSMYQRYYRRNEIKDVTEHYPMSMNSTSGVKNALRSTHTAIYHYQHYVGYNQYSWYFFNAKGSSSARGGRINLDVTWTTGHAAGVGFGKYDILYRSMHSNSRIDVTDFVKYHEDHQGGSYYGWSGSPNVDVYESTSTGDSAGFYLRVQGHISANNNSYDGYTIQSFRLVSLESDYNFSDECSFRFVGNSTPSDANGSAESRQSPNG